MVCCTLTYKFNNKMNIKKNNLTLKSIQAELDSIKKARIDTVEGYPSQGFS